MSCNDKDRCDRWPRWYCVLFVARTTCTGKDALRKARLTTLPASFVVVHYYSVICRWHSGEKEREIPNPTTAAASPSALARRVKSHGVGAAGE